MVDDQDTEIQMKIWEPSRRSCVKVENLESGNIGSSHLNLETLALTFDDVSKASDEDMKSKLILSQYLTQTGKVKGGG